MKLYTRTGDQGDTGLYGGQRVGKDSLRVEAYGTVDELNSELGLAISGCPHPELTAPLREIQSRLFEVGADLATPRRAHEAESDRAPGGVERIGEQQISEMERLIDLICAPLPAMKHFVLPGGTQTAARLHIARTVCRRAERLVVGLSRIEPVGNDLIIYLNRLSDLLFAMARRANQLDGVEDVPWVGRGR